MSPARPGESHLSHLIPLNPGESRLKKRDRSRRPGRSGERRKTEGGGRTQVAMTVGSPSPPSGAEGRGEEGRRAGCGLALVANVSRCLHPLSQGIEVAGEKHSIFRAGCARLAGQGLATGRSVTAAEAHLPAFWRPAYRACRGFRLLKSLRRADKCHTRIHLSKRCVSRSIDANIAATVAPLGAC